LSADGKVPETMRLTCNQCPQIELASVLAICNTYVRMYPAISAIGLVSVHSPYQHCLFRYRRLFSALLRYYSTIKLYFAI
jgi:hypothetical protein